MSDFMVIGGWAAGLMCLVAAVLFVNRDLGPKSNKK